MSERYRTIVADPPWPGKWWSGGSRKAGKSSGSERVYAAAEPAYKLMSIEDICRLPVGGLAAEEAHLYLWIPDPLLVLGVGATVAEAWDFRPGRPLIWRKRNMGLGEFPRPAHEVCLVCTRGASLFRVRDQPSVQTWKQVYVNGGKLHSAKPDGFYDLVKTASPGPYAELFARRGRLGWDYPIGDQALGGAAV